MPPHSARAADRHDLGAGPLGISKYDRDLFGSNTLAELYVGCAVAAGQDH